MKGSGFTDEEVRAAFLDRAAGAPTRDLRHRIGQATRRVQQRSSLVVILGGRGRRPFLARFGAIAAVAAAVLVAPFLSVESSDLPGLDVTNSIPSGRTSVAAIAPATEEDHDVDDPAEGDDDDEHEEEPNQGRLGR